jgi:nitroimidazol reductase NimA-like FMN-containing flavoprotein (pyridoxamine 5'-phosphate oxidase superfamily)
MSKDYDPDNTPANSIRRSELARDEAWIREFLSMAEVGHLATRWDEQPFITPLLFWYDDEAHAIYFHAATVGRLHANSQRHPRACFEACRTGRLLASNVALEFALQYESVIAFGDLRLVEDGEEARRALYALIAKYYPGMKPGVEYRPITEQELNRTAVYAMSISSWSGKRNWPERAKQSTEWQSLDERLL